MVVTTNNNDIVERLSIAYLTAVAGRAGCQISKLEIDKQSIDATVRPISGRKLSIDFQLKATAQNCIENGYVKHQLKKKNYDDLRTTHCTSPHFLIILVLPSDPTLWMQSDANQLSIQNCAYWMDLRGMPSLGDQASVSIKIPVSQAFNVSALMQMLTAEDARVTPA